MTTISPTCTSRDWDEVIARAQQLDPEAFDEIVDAYAGRLCGFFRRLLGKNADAEDLTQEVFVRVVRNIGSYSESGRFEAWLFRIAANLARDYIRSGKRSLSIVDTHNDEDDGLDVSDKRATLPPDRTLEQVDESIRLQKVIDRLPAGEREVILLRHYGELSFADIAEYMDTPIGTALARAHRGLAKLREWME